MIYLPPSPVLGGANLVAYIAADPRRATVFGNIRSRLAAAAEIGDVARYYVARNPFRRAVLRGILLATHQRLPEWVKETREAAEANSQFISEYRETYNAFRQQVRANATRSHSTT